MKVLQNIADMSATLDNGETATPIATLKDEYGGISHIILDDHCYVLLNGSENEPFGMSAWWYKEAVEALRTLPLPH